MGINICWVHVWEPGLVRAPAVRVRIWRDCRGRRDSGKGAPRRRLRSAGALEGRAARGSVQGRNRGVTCWRTEPCFQQGGTREGRLASLQVCTRSPSCGPEGRLRGGNRNSAMTVFKEAFPGEWNDGGVKGDEERRLNTNHREVLGDTAGWEMGTQAKRSCNGGFMWCSTHGRRSPERVHETPSWVSNDKADMKEPVSCPLRPRTPQQHSKAADTPAGPLSACSWGSRESLFGNAGPCRTQRCKSKHDSRELWE